MVSESKTEWKYPLMTTPSEGAIFELGNKIIEFLEDTQQL